MNDSTRSRLASFRGGAAEIRGICLNERWIEIVLTNQQAQLVAQSRLDAVARAIRGMTIRTRPGREGHLRSGERTELFDTAKADSISLSESPVDGSRLGNAHFGAADQRRRVGGIGIAVTDKAARARSLENGRLEDPAACGRVRMSFDQRRLNAAASVTPSNPEEARVRHIPFAAKKLKVSACDREGMLARQLPQTLQCSFGRFTHISRASFAFDLNPTICFFIYPPSCDSSTSRVTVLDPIVAKYLKRYRSRQPLLIRNFFRCT